MNKNITIGQAMGAVISILIAVISGWISLNSQVSKQEEAINTLRENYSEIKNDLKEMRADQKETKNTLIDIRVMLEKKADVRDLPSKTK